jgi:hypothetical protein
MHPRTICLALSILAVVVGVLGMALSFVHLALSGMGPAVEDAVAGSAGLVAGSILFGAGLISATILYGRGPVRPHDDPEPFPRATDKFRRQAGPED